MWLLMLLTLIFFFTLFCVCFSSVLLTVNAGYFRWGMVEVFWRTDLMWFNLGAIWENDIILGMSLFSNKRTYDIKDLKQLVCEQNKMQKNLAYFSQLLKINWWEYHLMFHWFQQCKICFIFCTTSLSSFLFSIDVFFIKSEINKNIIFKSSTLKLITISNLSSMFSE